MYLKSKYRGVLLVATAVDGNSNLYPIAFGIVDSENSLSWNWFFTQLKVVIKDEQGLAFVSDRNVSLVEELAKVYPLSSHRICIHHLLSNVVKHFKPPGLAALIEKASKAYRVLDFEKLYHMICNMGPLIRKYLEEADVKKWARCHFLGYMFDIRTNNPAESINSALRSPREYPVIPLLDEIREMLTRWFHKRRAKSAKHTDPLTKKVEKKIARRTEKAKYLIAYQVNDDIFQVKGDKFECVVDLRRRTCSCRKFDLGKIPCRHAIKAILSTGREPRTYTDKVFSTDGWRTVYEESIYPIAIPEDEWHLPEDVEKAQVRPPITKSRSGRRKKRRHATVEDKIRSSQGSQSFKRRHKCGRCGKEGHNRATCEKQI